METVVSALSGIIGALIAAIVAYIVAKRQVYGDITTKSRIDWIQRVRELTINFINSYPDSVKMRDIFISLRMYLNPCEKIDVDIIKEAEKCVNGESNTKDFSNMMLAYLKTEWERAKIESKGKKFYNYMFEEKYNYTLKKIEETKNCKSEECELKMIKFDKCTYKIDVILNLIFKILIDVGIGIAIAALIKYFLFK